MNRVTFDCLLAVTLAGAVFNQHCAVGARSRATSSSARAWTWCRRWSRARCPGACTCRPNLSQQSRTVARISSCATGSRTGALSWMCPSATSSLTFDAVAGESTRGGPCKFFPSIVSYRVLLALHWRGAGTFSSTLKCPVLLGRAASTMRELRHPKYCDPDVDAEPPSDAGTVF
jgi:hypothetical protein